MLKYSEQIHTQCFTITYLLLLSLACAGMVSETACRGTDRSGNIVPTKWIAAATETTCAHGMVLAVEWQAGTEMARGTTPLTGTTGPEIRPEAVPSGTTKDLGHSRKYNRTYLLSSKEIYHSRYRLTKNNKSTSNMHFRLINGLKIIKSNKIDRLFFLLAGTGKTNPRIGMEAAKEIEIPFLVVLILTPTGFLLAATNHHILPTVGIPPLAPTLRSLFTTTQPVAALSHSIQLNHDQSTR